jgi:hypothetical protein
LKDLWTIKQGEEPIISVTTDENADPITVEELIEVMKYSKTKKPPGYGGINVEIIKYAPTVPHYRFLNLLYRVFRKVLQI